MSLREGAPRSTGTLDIRKEVELENRGSRVDFGGVQEIIVTRSEYSLAEARKELSNMQVWVFGYGIQGSAQSQNLLDNGIPVKIWQRERHSKPSDERPTSWEDAIGEVGKDGNKKWKVGESLFSDLKTVTAAMGADKRPKLIQILLSDAGQVSEWPNIAKLLRSGDAIQFSHGFSLAFSYLTGVVPPSFVDVTLMAPKGPGGKVREHAVNGRGVNSSIAIAQNASGRALERTLASGMGAGSGFLFPTTFERETWSDNVGENASLIAGVDGLIKAGFDILTEDLRLLPEEAVWHTSEIVTQTISKIIGEKGADGLVNDLPKDLLPYFSRGFDAAYTSLSPVLEDLYSDVSKGVIAKTVIEANSKDDYRDTLDQELKDIDNSNLGKAATAVRLKREREGRIVPSSIVNPYDALIAGALIGLMQRQYELLRKKGHSPSEAFNETTEEATQSLYPYIDTKGIHELYKRCSTTAQRGALDHNEVFRKALVEPLKGLYVGIKKGERSDLDMRVIDHILNSEMWKAGKTTRNLRPENQRLS